MQKEIDDLFSKYNEAVNSTKPINLCGEVTAVIGSLIECTPIDVAIGDFCKIALSSGGEISCEVVSVLKDRVRLLSYDSIEGIQRGCVVTTTNSQMSTIVGEALLGRVIDCKGNPLDEKGPIATSKSAAIFATPPSVMKRKMIDERIFTGVRAIDYLTPVAKGQRMGIFAGSGVGKSTLLGMIARNTSADINVIALIGERGREVAEFIHNDLGEEGLKRSVVVVSQGDSPALARVRGALVAMTIAEYFREQGNDVMMLFDSVTRFAMAQRDIGLSIGEPVASKGYSPSVATHIQKLLERCGTSESGTITGFFTVLVEGDDMDDYVADTVRGIVDGHLILSRQLANASHYPAIDVLSSVSRLANKITSDGEKDGAKKIRHLLSLYKEKEDLINVGAYQKGSNILLDEAVIATPKINRFLQQGTHEKEPFLITLKKASLIININYDYLFEEYKDELSDDDIALLEKLNTLQGEIVADTKRMAQGAVQTQNRPFQTRPAISPNQFATLDRSRVQFATPSVAAASARGIS